MPGIMVSAVCNKKHFIYVLQQGCKLGTIITSHFTDQENRGSEK